MPDGRATMAIAWGEEERNPLALSLRNSRRDFWATVDFC